MLRLLEVELNGAALGAPQNIPVAPFSIATGVAAAPFLREIIDRAAAKCHTKLDYQIYPIVNHFFGETITVAGLLTGQDLLAQLRGRTWEPGCFCPKIPCAMGRRCSWMT